MSPERPARVGRAVDRHPRPGSPALAPATPDADHSRRMRMNAGGWTVAAVRTKAWAIAARPFDWNSAACKTGWRDDLVRPDCGHGTSPPSARDNRSNPPREVAAPGRFPRPGDRSLGETRRPRPAPCDARANNHR